MYDLDILSHTHFPSLHSAKRVFRSVPYRASKVKASLEEKELL
jgi:hypothetical protein